MPWSATPWGPGAPPTERFAAGRQIMYVVTVQFTLDSRHTGSFIPLMLENARVSRETERGCRQFDVCRDPAQSESVFLYEVYDSRAAPNSI